MLDSINRFTSLILTSAKKHIPRGHRKKYIPFWSEMKKVLLEDYDHTHNASIADELLNSLQEGRRNKWVQTMENMHALNLLEGTRPWLKPKCRSAPTEADRIAKQIKQRSTRVTWHTFESVTGHDFQRLYKSYPEADSAPLILVAEDEVEAATSQMKVVKTAGLNGIYPEMIKHLGPKANLWLS